MAAAAAPPRQLVRREDLQVQVCEGPWSRGCCLPFYSRAAALGEAWFHDHRYVTHLAGVKWGHQFRKQERERQIIPRIMRQFALHHGEYLRNEDKSRHLPTLMSSRLTVAWVTERFTMGLFAGDRAAASYTDGWSKLLDALGERCAELVQSGDVDGACEMNIGALKLTVGPYATVDTAVLAQMYSDLVDDWAFLASSPEHHLAPYVVAPPLMQLWRFVVLRCFRGAVGLPDGHPCLLLRAALLQAIGWFVEAGLELEVSEDRPAASRPAILELYGPSGRTRCHHRPAHKLRALEILETTHGSAETIMRAAGFHKGSNAQLRAAKLQIYEQKRQELFSTSCGFVIGWDGSCHGGTTMIAGSVVDGERGCAAYITPQATPIICRWASQSGLGEGGQRRHRKPFGARRGRYGRLIRELKI